MDVDDKFFEAIARDGGRVTAASLAIDLGCSIEEAEDQLRAVMVDHNTSSLPL